MSDVILVANAGSSSLKISVFSLKNKKLADRLYLAFLEKKGEEIIFHLTSRGNSSVVLTSKFEGDPINFMIKIFHEWWDKQQNLNLLATGHRIVHGGKNFSNPVIVNDDIIQKIKDLIPLNPLHQPYNLQVLSLFREKYTTLPHIACFDTAFHANQSKLEKTFGLSNKFFDKGVHKYGFHGLSYQWITSNFESTTSQKLPEKTIIAHLGSGSSMCAVKNGKSIATSMGFSVLDGLVMGTRVGAIDPGVILYLLDYEKMSSVEITDLLYRKSGLLGVSGESSDVRVLLESKSADAKFAIDLFVYRIQLEIGRLTSALQGLDCLIFTAGIGQNSAIIRKQVTCGMKWLGIELDETKNHSSEYCISSNDSKVKVFAIPTNEEGIIANEVVNLL